MASREKFALDFSRVVTKEFKPTGRIRWLNTGTGITLQAEMGFTLMLGGRVVGDGREWQDVPTISDTEGN